MKLLRLGEKGKEKPAIVDDQDNYKDLSSVIEDFNPKTLNFETLKKSLVISFFIFFFS